ncbi:unnamed protein product [Mytilus edulis]|uniref:Ankyrin repeat protein n=1 Tax=Mytilus edulis TaxID=6550 RepID=A0A8S3UGA5_MYTED|nr:unnamed protein product [Mytilus edulis]
MLLNACQYKRLNSVKFLFKSFKHETFDFNEILIAVVKNVRKESNTEVLQCLLENVKGSSSEMSKSILSVCEIIWPKDMDALLKNADPSLFDSKSILKRAVRNRRKGSLECLVKWIITNVNPNILDLTEIMNIVCVLQVLEIGKLLIQTIENSLLDVNVIMIAAIQKHWEGEHESFILWLISHIDLALFNFKTIEAEACKNGKLDEIKLLLSKTDHNLFDLGKIMQNACEHGKLDIVQYLLSDDDRTKLQVDTAIVSACSTGHLHIVKYVIKNCDLALLNIKLAMQKAVVCGQHEIVAWLLFNCDHDMFDISNLMNKACSFGWLDIVKWLFEKIDISLFDMLMAIHEACNKCHIELIEFLIENVRFSEDSLKSVMTLSCFRGNIDIVKLLLHKQNDDCHMYDMRVAMNDACSGGRIELVQWLLKSSNRHDKFDMEFVLKWVCINEHLNLATWIFDNIDHSSISWSSLFHWVCSKGHIASMNFLLQKIDNKLLNFKRALTDTCIEGHLNVVHRLFEIHRFSLIEVKHAMNECIRFEHAIINKWIMQNIGINANDIKMTLEWTQENNNIRLMTFLVLNIDITDTINILCSKGHFELIQWILLNVHAPLLDFNILMNEASRHGRLDIVKNIFERFMTTVKF